MNPRLLANLIVFSVLSGLVASSFFGVAAAQKPACGSGHNLAHVQLRLVGAINQLNADSRDYGGYRTDVVNDLNAAHADLVGAQSYAINTEHQDPSCFTSSSSEGNPANADRGQHASDSSIAGIHTRIQNLIAQLRSDNDDYGGKKHAAIGALQSALNHLAQAQSYAQAHGY